MTRIGSMLPLLRPYIQPHIREDASVLVAILAVLFLGLML